MSPKRQRFVEEYLVDHNATQAAIRAGYSAATAEQAGYRLLRDVELAAAIDAKRKHLAEMLEIDASRVLAEAWRILTADPRELVSVHVDCCRHCYGTNHRYQRTAGEMEGDRAAHALRVLNQNGKGASPTDFDEKGGIGFDPRRSPAEDCPECHGRGLVHVRVHDTSEVSAAALSLYAGAKQTRDGLEVKMHPKMDAMEKLCRHLGLYDRVKASADARVRLSAAASFSDQGRAVIDAAVGGDLTVAQASQLLVGLGTLAKLVETDELVARVAALEARRRQ